jgi:hypothetical protein
MVLPGLSALSLNMDQLGSGGLKALDEMSKMTSEILARIPYILDEVS